MLTVYGALMPLRLLEEIRFWKMREKEHTVVIRELAPSLEPVYVQVLKEWEPVFARTEFEAGQWMEAALRSPSGITPHIQLQLKGLLNLSVEQSNAFVRQLPHMLSHSTAITANPAAKAVIPQMIRESEYFLGVLQGYMAGGSHYTGAAGQSVREPPFRHTTGIPSTQLTGEGSWSTWTDTLASRLQPIPPGGHRLPPLPYSYDALEPHIDTETMRLHHDKHHQTYVDGLNKAETKLAETRKTGDFALIKHWEREAAFHGAGHYLHTIFWNVMAPQAGGKPTGPIADQLRADFGSFEAFKKQFSEAADKVEGGGWAILVWSPRSHRTEILQAEKHQNLSQWDVVPLLVLDVWEHAYYLKYQNNRSKYIDAWWNVVNWKHVSERLEAARQLQWTPY